MNIDFENTSLKKLLFQLSTPMIIAYVVQALYNVADSIVVGNAIGPICHSALGIVFPIQLILSSVSTLFAAGASTLIAINLGKKDFKKAQLLGTSVHIVGIFITVIAAFLVFLFSRQLLNLFDMDNGQSIELSKQYLNIIYFGLPFVAIANTITFVLRACGKAKIGMTIMIIGTVVNIVLNPIFVFGFNMGVQGAALATIIAQILGALYALYVGIFKNTYLPIIKIKFQEVVFLGFEMAKLGFSSFISTFTFCLVVLVSNLVLKDYGSTKDMALFGTVLKINELMILPLFGLIAGMQPIVSYNYGKRNISRSLEAFKLTLKYASIFLVVVIVTLQLFPIAILSIFGIDYGALEVRIAFSFFIFTCIQITCSMFLQAIEHKYQATIISLSRQLFTYIPVVLILSYYLGNISPELGVMAVWLSLPISDIVAGLVGFLLTSKVIKKLKV